MKRPLELHRRVKSQEEVGDDFIYNKLYEERNVDQKHPFEFIKNDKLELLKKLPQNNLKLLESFQRSQEDKKKRIPKIISLFLKNKRIV